MGKKIKEKWGPAPLTGKPLPTTQYLTEAQKTVWLLKFISTSASLEQIHVLALDGITVIHALRDALITNSVSQSLLFFSFKFILLGCNPWHQSCLSVLSYLVFVSVSSPVSDAAGHNRVYLRAGLDHLSRHRGKQGACCQCAFQLLKHQGSHAGRPLKCAAHMLHMVMY